MKEMYNFVFLISGQSAHGGIEICFYTMDEQSSNPTTSNVFLQSIVTNESVSK
jgi:hypothetical protein